MSSSASNPSRQGSASPAVSKTGTPQPASLPIRSATSTPRSVASVAVSSTGSSASSSAATKLAQVDGADAAPKKLSGAELKKRAKAEKLARRQAQRSGRETAAESLAGASGAPELGGAVPGSSASASPAAAPAGSLAPGAAGSHRPSFGAGAGTGRGSGTPILQQPLQEQKKQKNSAATAKPKADDKSVAVFNHLGIKRRSTIAGANKDVHPAVLALGVQMSHYVICGSSARCIAMLLAFKRVVESYVTPPKTSLTRHLTTHLSPQITYLTSCRPLSTSQGNAIRALKLAISAIDPSVPDHEAKVSLYEWIDQYIRERITVAHQAIANSAADKIRNGDVVLTYGKSHCVMKTLLLAHSQRRKFRVVVVDSRPLFEGKALARTLAKAGLDVTYSLISGLHHALKDVTKVFLGAHAMMSNGQLYARVGSAMVAMAAKARQSGISTPVIVCCETLKFTDRVTLDSVVQNEVAPPEELVPLPRTEQVALPHDKSTAAAAASDSNAKGSSAKKGSRKGGDSSSTPGGPHHDGGHDDCADGDDVPIPDPLYPLKYWKQKPHLQILNIMYDVTPKQYIDLVITEMGNLPPSAVPVVQRISMNMAAQQ